MLVLTYKMWRANFLKSSCNVEKYIYNRLVQSLF